MYKSLAVTKESKKLVENFEPVFVYLSSLPLRMSSPPRLISLVLCVESFPLEIGSGLSFARCYPRSTFVARRLRTISPDGGAFHRTNPSIHPTPPLRTLSSPATYADETSSLQHLKHTHTLSRSRSARCPISAQDLHESIYLSYCSSLAGILDGDFNDESYEKNAGYTAHNPHSLEAANLPIYLKLTLNIEIFFSPFALHHGR